LKLGADGLRGQVLGQRMLGVGVEERYQIGSGKLCKIAHQLCLEIHLDDMLSDGGLISDATIPTAAYWAYDLFAWGRFKGFLGGHSVHKQFEGMTALLAEGVHFPVSVGFLVHGIFLSGRPLMRTPMGWQAQ